MKNGFNKDYQSITPKIMSKIYEENLAKQTLEGITDDRINKVQFQQLSIAHTVHKISTYFSNLENSKVYTNQITRQIISDIESDTLVYSGYCSQEHTMLSLLRTLKLLSVDCYLNRYKDKSYDFKDDACVEPPLHASSLLFEVSELRTPTPTDSNSPQTFIRLLYNGRLIKL